MKLLILLVLILLVSCSESTFEICTEQSKMKSLEFSIYIEDDYHTTTILPYTLTAKNRDEVGVEYIIKASNWDYNHPECDCDRIGVDLFKCIQYFVVDGSDFLVGGK